MIATDVFAPVTNKRGDLDGKPMTEIRWEKSRYAAPYRYHEHLPGRRLASGWDKAVLPEVDRAVPFTCIKRVVVNGVLSFEYLLADLASEGLPPISNVRDRNQNQSGILRAEL